MSYARCHSPGCRDSAVPQRSLDNSQPSECGHSSWSDKDLKKTIFIRQFAKSPITMSLSAVKIPHYSLNRQNEDWFTAELHSACSASKGCIHKRLVNSNPLVFNLAAYVYDWTSKKWPNSLTGREPAFQACRQGVQHSNVITSALAHLRKDMYTIFDGG